MALAKDSSALKELYNLVAKNIGGAGKRLVEKLALEMMVNDDISLDAPLVVKMLNGLKGSITLPMPLTEESVNLIKYLGKKNNGSKISGRKKKD
jgi:hypothetical protein